MLPLLLAQADAPLSSERLTEVCGADPTWICRRVLESTDSDFWAQAADWAVAKPLVVLVILAVAWLLNAVVRRSIRRFVERAQSEGLGGRVGAKLRRRSGFPMLDTTSAPVENVRRAARAGAIGAVLRSVATFTIYALAIFIALGELGLNLGPLIAGAGIVGVALGFGAQSLVKDFLSGIFMIIEDQFGVGDVIDVGETSGVVEGLSLRTVRIRDVNGVVWHVPNGEIHRVGNKSQDWARALLDIPLAIGTDIDHASAVIHRVAHELWEEPAYGNEVLLEEPEVWGVEDLGAHGIVIRLVVKTKPREQFNVQRELRGRLKRTFDAEGIHMPTPATWTA